MGRDKSDPFENAFGLDEASEEFTKFIFGKDKGRRKEVGSKEG